MKISLDEIDKLKNLASKNRLIGGDPWAGQSKEYKNDFLKQEKTSVIITNIPNATNTKQ